MSDFDEKIIERLKRLEREVERLQVKERPVVITDHGALTGLGDDDHTQYVKDAGTVTDNAIVRYDGTDGRTIQNSKATIDDNGNLIVTGYTKVTDYITAEGGLHVGGTSDPGTDNLVVDGTIKDGSGNEYLKTPQWTAYTPTWTAATTNPSIGNGTLAGRYTQIGKTCVLVIGLTMGSTTTYGSGEWSFSLPKTAKNTSGINYYGVAHIRNAGTANYERVAQIAPPVSTTVINTFIDPTSGSNSFNISSTVPFTWGDGDALGIEITYEIA